MIEETQENPVLELFRERNIPQLVEFSVESHPQTIAEYLNHLEPGETWQILKLLPLGSRVEIFSCLELTQQVALVSGQSRAEMASLIEEMAPDDRADLVLRLDPQVREDILPLVARAEREDIRRLVSYEEGTAGAVMSTDYATLRPDVGINEALGQLRTQASVKETIYYVYIIDEKHRLVGFVSLKDLILAKPSQSVADVMHEEVLSIRVDEDQEEAAKKIERYGLIAIPVVDSSNMLLGIITYDDAMAILDKEQAEDLLAFGGVTADPESDDTLYWQSRVTSVVRRRVSWLVMLFLAEGMTGSVLRYYQWVERDIPDLSLFVPLLIGTGGNAGSQAVSTVIRGISTGEIGRNDVFRVVFREMLTGLLLGILLGALGFMYTDVIRGQNTAFSLVIGFTVMGICTWANTVGALVPILAKRLKIDPAVVSAPMIATLVDATGLIIYYSIAIFILLHMPK